MGNESKVGGVVNPSPLIPHPSSLQFTTLPPLSLYIHIPWCARKCPYCDFNSHEARGPVPEDRYVAALIADLELALPLVWGRRVYTVFFGGGTPSLLSARAIDAVLAAVRARLPLAADAEITLEANPGTFEADKFRDFRAAGVNRLSVGIQSFNPARLIALGRIHDDVDARRAIEVAGRDFENMNLDLMYGLPEQAVDDALTDIETAISYSPQHISAYHLTIEPNTYFHRYPPRLPSDDTTAAMQDAIEARLAYAGYDHYETSAYAKRGKPLDTRHSTTASERISQVSCSDMSAALRAAGGQIPEPVRGPSSAPRRAPVTSRCAHNLNYWTFGDYLGIGAGAHSKLSFPDRIVRQMRVKHPGRYLEAVERSAPVDEEHGVEAGQVGFEFMMNALRLNDGIAIRLFLERTGMPLTAVLRGLDEAEQRGLLARDHARIAPTPLGQRFLNDLLQIFLPDAPRGRRRLRQSLEKISKPPFEPQINTDEHR